MFYRSVFILVTNKSYSIMAMDRPGPVHRTAKLWTGPESDHHLQYQTTCGQAVRYASLIFSIECVKFGQNQETRTYLNSVKFCDAVFIGTQCTGINTKIAIKISNMDITLPFNSSEYLSYSVINQSEISRCKKILICPEDIITQSTTYLEE